MTWEPIDEVHDAESTLVNSNVVDVWFVAKLGLTCGSRVQNNFDAKSNLHFESDLMYDGDESSFDESDMSSLNFWDEVGV